MLLKVFITHFFILFSTAYAFVHFRFRPTKVGFLCSFLLLVTLAFIMYFVNNKLGTNFLYVNHPPVTKSLMDFMGPWPYYIFSLAGIDIAISFFMYLPFRKIKIKIWKLEKLLRYIKRSFKLLFIKFIFSSFLINFKNLHYKT